MEHKENVCRTLHRIHPDIGECGKDLRVEWNENLGVWAVDFHKRGNRIKHFVDPQDMIDCMDKNKCVGLGIEFAQF